MFVSSLKIKTFRCFEALTIDFSEPITVLEGQNGAGKTSIIEALYYACYLRSFKTHIPKDLIQWTQNHFFIALDGMSSTQDPWQVRIAVTQSKKIIKADGALLVSYKELFDRYRVVILSAHDMELIQGPPEERRLFIDQAILLTDPSYIQKLRTLRKVLKQRNAFLAQGVFEKETYTVWTDQLVEISNLIRAERQSYLALLEKEIQRLLREYIPFDNLLIELSYQENSEKNCYPEKEFSAKRSLQGAHLDELHILWNGQSARKFASRGQHKLLIYFLKIAQLNVLQKPAIVLIDDFVTDFDNFRTELLTQLICGKERQIIFTAPTGAGSTLFHTLKEKHLPVERQQIK